jgi:hypothetical protein
MKMCARRDRIRRSIGGGRPPCSHAPAPRRAGLVKLKLDENLPASAAPRLAALGHDVGSLAKSDVVGHTRKIDRAVCDRGLSHDHAIVHAATVDGCRTTRPGMFWKSSVLNVTSSVTPEESITAAIRASCARLP